MFVPKITKVENPIRVFIFFRIIRVGMHFFGFAGFRFYAIRANVLTSVEKRKK